eukprot:jgi/Tetstr1/442610/TSEL_030706.t1
MQQHHTDPTLLRVGVDNLCAMSLGKEDEEFADTLRLAVALTSLVALLRTVRLRTIVIYLTESKQAKGKAAASAKHKKKKPRGRSHSCGTTRNRSKSKPRLSGTHNSDSDWETDDEAAQLYGSSHR